MNTTMLRKFFMIALPATLAFGSLALAGDKWKEQDWSNYYRVDCRYHNNEDIKHVNFCYASAVYRVEEGKKHCDPKEIQGGKDDDCRKDEDDRKCDPKDIQGGKDDDCWKDDDKKCDDREKDCKDKDDKDGKKSRISYTHISMGVGCDNETIYNDAGRVQREELGERISPKTSAFPAIEISPKNALANVGTYESVLDISAGRLSGKCYVHKLSEDEIVATFLK